MCTMSIFIEYLGGEELQDAEKLRFVFEKHRIDKVVHLAALTHRMGKKDCSYELYYKVNVKCPKILLEEAAERKNPDTLYRHRGCLWLC